MAKVTGIGGIFFKGKDPAKLAEWYAMHLGINMMWEHGSVFEWNDQKGMTVWSIFKADSKYYEPGTATFMVNFRVDDLEELLQELRDAGQNVVGDMMVESNGKFGWVVDPEGNKIELWEPAA